ncbi:hypothetical protein GON26_09505 [Flavobacterium sp. GA093]|uniref:GLPGLI family protein n=1 Tax=Flavobacterium hydrocarbonoxydans TaxID=2683249 RepID=A0A6I4NSF9_9FLAO|nr:hypothetical protein [Flavobacterium hydrocarbonoxydans]MWB94599.1 hypothetical protein [Flavobacterium hydrocarbonoxydans]
MKYLLLLLIVSLNAFSQEIPMSTRRYTNKEIGSTFSSEIGESLITTGKEYFQKACKVTERPDKKIKISFYPFDVHVDEILPLKAEKHDYDLYYGDLKPNGSNPYAVGIAYNRKTKLYSAFAQGPTGFSVKEIDGLKVEPAEYFKSCEECFKKEFVYNGKSGNTLKFVYREYINDMARPAFTQDIQYDLADGNIIGIKGLRIEVISTNNMRIEYKILNDFN